MDRRDSTYSNASDATHKSSSTDSSGQSMSDEEAAWLLLTMGKQTSPTTSDIRQPQQPLWHSFVIL